MRPIAGGRDCEIFDLGNGTLLRRQRQGRSLEPEAEVMRHVAASGFPCPTVHSAHGPDMVLDYLDGPTMAHDLFSDPTRERARVAGALLAELHHRLHRLPPLRSPDGTILHLDLHPENVMLTRRGPVVIDWTNATDGPPELDIAMTWVILEPFAQALPLARHLVNAYLDAVGRPAASKGLRAASERRLSDPNTTEQERAAIKALLSSNAPF